MNSLKKEEKLKIVLITGSNDRFITELITKFKAVNEINFEDIIYWKPEITLLMKLKRNIKKHGAIYVPYRIIKYIKELIINKIYNFLEAILLWPFSEENLFSISSKYGINLIEINDIHSKKGIEIVRSLNCDILAVCGTGILRETVFDLPKIGTINLHQGEAQKYKGAPPGFWELWNNEKQVGITIHFVDKGVDTGDIILQKLVPIFEYDRLSSIQNKLSEISLELYPEAIKQIANKSYRRTKQPQNIGKQYFFPTLKQQFFLYKKILFQQFDIYLFCKSIVKRLLWPIVILVISLRDLYLRKRGKTIISILYYHRVTNICKDGMTIDISSFERQIRFLKKHYRIISSEDIKNIIAGNTEKYLGKNCCLITFDDGYEDNFINALPILKRYACPAIFFVATGLISNEKQFDHDKELQSQLFFKKMTWEQLHNAVQSNIEIGVHTETHCNLGKITFQKACAEIDVSIKNYKDQFDQEPVFMSFPFGGKKDITKDIINYIKDQTSISFLFSAYGGKNISPVNSYDIKRINVGSDDKGIFFWLKGEGHFKTLFCPYDRL